MGSHPGRRAALLVALTAGGLAAVWATGWRAYAGARGSIEAATFERLTALRQSKRREIGNYLDDLHGHLRVFSADATVAAAVTDFASAFDALRAGPDDAADLRRLYESEVLPRMPRTASGPGDAGELLPSDDSAEALQAMYVARNPHPLGHKQDLVDAGDGSVYSAVHAKHHPQLRKMLETYGFYDIFLIEPAHGRLVYTVMKEIDVGTSLDTGPYRASNLARVYRTARDAEASDTVSFADFERYPPSYLAPAAFLASPIVHEGELVGVFAAQVPVDRINRVMTGGRRWREDGLGESGETYLVGTDALMRSDSRFILESPDRFFARLVRNGVSPERVEAMRQYETTILFKDVRTVASEAALRGEQDTRIVDDYRGLPVLSSFAPVDVCDLRWAILSEIDLAEAFAPLARLRRGVLVSSSLISLLFIGVALLLLRQLARTDSVLRQKDRIEHDLALAGKIQSGLMPKDPPALDGFDVAGWSLPADETGGDYFDWQVLPDDRLAVTLADVTGHGIGPALVTATCRAFARASFPAREELGPRLRRINDLLVEDLPPDRFVTFVVGIIDAHENAVEVLSAGHAPLLVYRSASREVISLDAHDLPLGIVDGVEYGPGDTVQLDPGDAVVFVTDGFFEWQNHDGRHFGTARLTETVAEALANPRETADRVIERLYRAVIEFAGTSPQTDDLTAVVIRRRAE